MRFIILLLTVLTLTFQSRGEIKITTTVKPLSDIVREVGGDRVEVSYIIPSNVNHHLYEYKTTDIKKIYDSDLFIYIGSSDHGIKSVVKSLPKEKIFPLISLNGLFLVKDRDHEDIHPALWLDLLNGKTIAKFILDYLSQKDPKNKAYYEANYNRFSKELDELTSYGMEKFSKLKNRNFVSYHYEFPYFVGRFKLIYLADIEMGHGREPTPKHILNVIEKMKANNVKSVFTSKQLYNKKVLDLVLSKTNAKVIFLDTQGENPSYLDMIRFNIDRVYEGLNY
ncbi:MAG: metal ABC transporter substrate-binding protein [Hydrogenothermaceae bacterium]|nr:metal ABC transporter substrate-binding protein [Hydrogenothermaceae bacterium]